MNFLYIIFIGLIIFAVCDISNYQEARSRQEQIFQNMAKDGWFFEKEVDGLYQFTKGKEIKWVRPE